MSGFLPQGYEPPVSGNYLKLAQGVTRIRILGPAIVGNMFWSEDSEGKRHPIRRRMGDKIEADELGFDKDGNPDKVKHFWAMAVWNYTGKCVQIWEVTQATIRDSIIGYTSDEDWGDPRQYDLKIGKDGTKLDTNYTVIAAPKKPIEPEIAKEFARINPYMDALFDGSDPFANTATSKQPLTSKADWTFDVAIAECAKVNISRDDLIAHLKANGHNAWSIKHTSPIAKALVMERQQELMNEQRKRSETGPAFDSIEEDNIPF